MIHRTITYAQPRKLKRRYFISITIIFALGIIFFLGFSIFRFSIFAGKVFKQQSLKDSIISFLPPVANASYTSDIDRSLKNADTVNMLLLGYGGVGHDGAYLTDSIMVVSINPKLKNIALISIPRDTWVQIPISTKYSSYGKINSAYEIGLDSFNYQDRSSDFKGKYGGGNIAKSVVSGMLGIPIDYYVGLDFSGFKNVINDIGGVDINVERSFDDYEYPSGDENTNGPVCSAPMNTKTTCRYWHLHFDAGMQRMDAATALEYTRSRYAYGIEGSDFARSQRQQKVISAVKSKMLQINEVPRLFDIMNSLQDNIQTDLTLSDVKDLVNKLKEWNLGNIIHGAISTSNLLNPSFSKDGQYILIPKAGLGDYSSIQEYVKNIWIEDQIKILK